VAKAIFLRIETVDCADYTDFKLDENIFPIFHKKTPIIQKVLINEILTVKTAKVKFKKGFAL